MNAKDFPTLNNFNTYKRKDPLRLGILKSHATHQPLTECSKKQPRCQKKNIKECRYAALLPAGHYPAFWTTVVLKYSLNRRSS